MHWRGGASPSTPFASVLTEQGGGPFAIRRVIEDSRLETISIYVHMSAETPREKIEKHRGWRPYLYSGLRIRELIDAGDELLVEDDHVSSRTSLGRFETTQRPRVAFLGRIRAFS